MLWLMIKGVHGMVLNPYGPVLYFFILDSWNIFFFFLLSIFVFSVPVVICHLSSSLIFPQFFLSLVLHASSYFCCHPFVSCIPLFSVFYSHFIYRVLLLIFNHIRNHTCTHTHTHSQNQAYSTTHVLMHTNTLTYKRTYIRTGN